MEKAKLSDKEIKRLKKTKSIKVNDYQIVRKDENTRDTRV